MLKTHLRPFVLSVCVGTALSGAIGLAHASPSCDESGPPFYTHETWTLELVSVENVNDAAAAVPDLEQDRWGADGEVYWVADPDSFEDPQYGWYEFRTLDLVLGSF